MKSLLILALLVILVLMGAARTEAAVINEIDLWGTATTFCEFYGSPGEDLSDATFIGIGDASGTIKFAIPFAGLSVPLDRYFVMGMGLVSPNADCFGFAYSDSAPYTLMLVRGFTGNTYDALDTNMDGTLDITPWTSIDDSCSFQNGDSSYSTNIIPVKEDGNLPWHAFRSPDGGPWECTRRDSDLGRYTTAGTANPAADQLPTDIILSASAVSEHQLPNVTVGTLSSVDSDAGDVFTYELVNDAGGKFRLEGTELRTVVELDYEIASSHVICIRTTDRRGKSFEKDFTISVIDGSDPPAVTTQPVLATKDPGQSVTFTVVVSGSAPLSYQWKKNGGNIAGATSASYTIGAVAQSDEATYTCYISNSAGNVTSNGATLTVNDPPSITTQPASATKDPSQSVTFTVVANGTAPLSYQWKKGGADIAGANAASYAIAAVAQSDEGSYTCYISNSAGNVTSNAATLIVNDPPAITTQPNSATKDPGQSVTFTVAISGSAPLAYQWKKNGGNIAGATSASYTIAAVAQSDEANYTCYISNTAGNVTSNAATLTVNDPPSITTQPGSATKDPGQSVTFTVAASGTAPISYQWKKNGGNIVGATSASYTIGAVAQTDEASYTCYISNSAGNVTSNGATLTVNDPPAITTQPASATRNPGQSVTFTVVASGTAPLSYQWKKDGTDIAGANSASYTIAAVAQGDEADYTCYISNSAGNITSSAATFTVNDPPAITSEPASATKDPGQSVTFSVAASGTAPLSYQWKKNGANIPGATLANYTIAAVAQSDEADYTCYVSNSAGNITSNAATLTVNDPPSITTQPGSATKDPGQSVTFTVAANGTAPLSYQWKKNGTDIPGATSASYTIAAVAPSDEANYSCCISNSAGNVTSSAATLTVNDPPAITTQPASATRNPGQSVTFTIVASGTAPLSYQWKKDGADIAGASSASYTIPAVAQSDEANYTCYVSNYLGNMTSNAATLTVNDPPAISAQPASATKDPGQSVTFSVTASGTAPLFYQWKRNGANIPGATLPNYTIAVVAQSDEADYTCYISNTAGNVTSNAATLTVNDPPAIATQPASVAKDPGLSATFTVAVNGTAPLSYQWKKNGTDIPGATLASYTITAVAPGDEANYTCYISNYLGNVTTNAATLTVNDPPAITTQPLSATRNPGQSVTFTVAASGTTPLSYQWKKDGANIAGATSPNYTIPAAAQTDEADYTCYVSNYLGNITSDAATLTVNDPPTITAQPASATKNPGQSVTFTVAATGTAPLTYQWKKNATNIIGANSADYTIAAVVQSDEANYTCYISNSAGNITSNVATLTVNDPPSAPTNPGATLISDSSITWTWVDNSSDETGFKIWADAGAALPTTLRVTTAPDATSWQMSDLSINAQYSIVIAASNAAGDSAKTSNLTKWTLVEPVSGLAFSNINTNAISVSSINTPGNLTAGSSGLYFANTTSGWASGWQQSNAVWLSNNLTPNTPYTFSGKSRNGAGVQTAEATAVKYTLSYPPVLGVNLTCNRSTSNVWYPGGTIITFSNPVGFGVGTHGSGYYKVSRFKVFWDTSFTHIFNGSEDDWDMGTLDITQATGGNYYLHIQALNAEGAANGTTVNYGPFWIDATSPTAGSITINNNAAYAGSAEVNLALYASDSGSQGIEMCLSNDGSTWDPWEAYSTTKAWTLANGEGEKTVYVQFRDAVGNVSEVISDDIIVDNTAPADPSIMINDGDGFTSSTSISLILSASDGVSGLAQMRLRNENASWGKWEAYSPTRSWTLPASDGAQAVYVEFRDTFGNISSEQSDSIVLDRTLPQSSMNALPASTHNPVLTLEWTATDSGDSPSGVREVSVYWNKDGGPFELLDTYPAVIASTVFDTTTHDGNGQYGFYCRATDNVGLTEFHPGTAQASVDVQANPSVSFMVTEPEWTMGTENTVEWTASDNASTYTIQCDISRDFDSPELQSAQLPDPALSHTFSGLTDSKTYWYRVRVTSPYGVKSSWSAPTSSIQDATQPTGSISINTDALYAADAGVTLTLTATDAGANPSGVAEMRLSNDGVTWDPWEAYAASKLWMVSTGDGPKKVYVEFRDKAGNVSSGEISDSIALDAITPISQVTTPSGLKTSADLTISWEANDAGSGISAVRIYWNRNDGVYALLGEYPPEVISIAFDASAHGGDGQYGFYSQAVDAAGNVEDGPTEPDAIVHVKTKRTRVNEAWTWFE